MAPADWIVLGVVVLAGLYGLLSGLVRGALSLAGFALGAYLGARVTPDLLREGSPYAPFLALGGALVGGVVLHGLAALVGGVVRTGLRAVPGMRALDSLGGLVLGAAAGLVLCWAVGAVLLYLPGQSELRREVQRSAILSRINEEIPPERLLETLDRVDPLGVLPGPPAAVPPPDSALARDPDVVAASRSVVRVTGIACGLGVEGSGWIVAPGLVVTNAHVVAGIAEPRIDRRVGRAWTGRVVAFDARNDLALVRVPGLRGRPLPLADPERGVPVTLVGYSGNGSLRRTPARLGATRELLAQDAYGSVSLVRSVTALRGRVQPGHSGGPGIDARGRVRTTVFARRSGERGGGFGVPPALVRALLVRAAEERVASTPCVQP
ncbi:MAG: CvpA family protein [Thermoleophilia bacterium]|nr:CvpA family protein [Thermoleophilia bacterium]